MNIEFSPIFYVVNACNMPSDLNKQQQKYHDTIELPRGKALDKVSVTPLTNESDRLLKDFTPIFFLDYNDFSLG